mgnify:FL=1|jgi:hypothetical protein
MNTYKNIIIDCLNNDKVIPPRIRLNIYDKILKRIIDDENNETKYICIELRKVLNDYNINIYNTNFYYKDINNEYIIKNYKICFPEFNRNLIFKNTNLFYSIKYSGISWFYTMQDRITFVKLMMGIVNKEIINN